MIRKNLSLTLLSLIIYTFLPAQQVELKLNLRDGNIISGKGILGNINLNTEFGKLDIPLKRISNIELGINADPATVSKVEKLLKQLENSNEELRRSAYSELIGLEISAISAIENFISSDKYQPSVYPDHSAENVLSELKASHGVSSFSEQDVIFLDNGNSISGNFDLKKIDLKTEYGSISVPKAKITTIEVVFAGEENETSKSFKLLGSKHISSNPNGGWIKTGFMVKPGQKIEINATGQIAFASLSGAAYKPDGSTSTSAAYPADDAYYGAGTYPTYGNVVYRIGESGPVQRAGAKITATANSSGPLFISVYETVFNPANSGSYNVQVSVK